MTDEPFWANPGGTWLRRVRDERQCAVPIAADKGDVWRCDCGRVWACWESGICLTRRAEWRRRPRRIRDVFGGLRLVGGSHP